MKGEEELMNKQEDELINTKGVYKDINPSLKDP